MFYNHEILTSREHGVAIVWLVATLGSKSSLKKVGRKDIIGVNVQKACQTITKPQAPMALRLQSSLLYGVSRVYSQQCAYVLADAQSAQNHLRQALKATNTKALDMDILKASRPDMLIVPEDPTFLPGMDLANVDFGFDFMDPGLLTDRSSQTSLLSSLHTPRSPGGGSMMHEQQIVIPSPGSSGLSGGMGMVDYDSLPGTDKQFVDMAQLGPNRLDEEVGLIMDPGFEFDEHGNMFSLSGTGARQEGVQTPYLRSRAGSMTISEQARQSQVRREHENARRAGSMHNGEGSVMDNFQLPAFDDIPTFPNAEPFPERTRDQERNLRPPSLTSRISSQMAEDSEFVNAPMARAQQARAHRPLKLDRVLELRNSDLADWERNYLLNMSQALKAQLRYQAPSLAKRNADHWVWGVGIGGIGVELGGLDLREEHPLSEFFGAGLKRAMTDTAGDQVVATGVQKRLLTDRETELESAEHGRRVRRRTDSRSEHGSQEEELFRDDQGVMMIDDQEPEVGRIAETPLGGDDMSSIMPWNVNASQRSSILPRRFHRAGSVSSALSFPAPSIQGQGLALPRFGIGSRRATSLIDTAPLPPAQPEGTSSGAGPADDAGFDEHGSDADHNFIVPRSNADRHDVGLALADVTARALDDFELYGPTTHVDTQTAADSQWMNVVLNEESNNFLDFIAATILEKKTAAVKSGGETADEENVMYDLQHESISFTALLSPGESSNIVAAQGLLHALTLATRGLLELQQDVEFGAELWLRIKGNE